MATITKETAFDINALDFSTIDVSDPDFFTIEFKVPDAEPSDGKYSLWVNTLDNKFVARIWVEGEKEFAADSEDGEIYQTDEDREPYFIDYAFSTAELDAIKCKFIQYMQYLIYGGAEFAIAEMSVPDGQEAWRKTA